MSEYDPNESADDRPLGFDFNDPRKPAEPDDGLTDAERAEFRVGGPAGGGDGPSPAENPEMIALRRELAQMRTLIRRLEAQVVPRTWPTSTSGGDMFFIGLTKTSGSDGGKTFGPSYTYSGTVNGTVTAALTPAIRLTAVGRYVEATVGIGRYVSGSLTLVLALEIRRTKDC